MKAWAAQVDERRFYLSIFTLAEYDKGVAQLPDDDPRRAEYAQRREELEARFAGRILPATDRVIRRWGEIAGRIRRDTGHPPKTVDAVIAATAIEADLWLATRNTRDFVLTGAVLFNPWLDRT